MSRFLPVCLFLYEFVCCLWVWHCLLLLAWFKIFCHSHCWFRLVPRISCWVMLGSNVWPFGLVTDYVSSNVWPFGLVADYVGLKRMAILD